VHRETLRLWVRQAEADSERVEWETEVRSLYDGMVGSS
jgi:hypothetical protein